jgi:hypothetical protein
MERNKDQPASPASDRILDRKIESRALSSGFSSNLGRKAPAGDKAGAGKGVKAIVDWLEKTSTSGPENPELKTPDARNKAGKVDGFSPSPDTTRSGLPQTTRPEAAIASPFSPNTPPTHPEEYSLTLLGYKSYFNNRPLARCLDDQHQVTSPAAKSTPVAASASSCYSTTQKMDSIMATLQEMRNGIDPGSPTPLSRHPLKHEARTVNSNEVYVALDVNTCTNGGMSEPQPAVDAQVARRNPAEAKTF